MTRTLARWPPARRAALATLILTPLAGAIAYALTGAGAAPAPASDDNPESLGRLVVVDERRPADVRAPTPGECEQMAAMLEASVHTLHAVYVDGARSTGIAEAQIERNVAEFEASVERSRAWIAAGCPPHTTLGVVDHPWGAELRLFDQNGSGGATWMGHEIR